MIYRLKDWDKKLIISDFTRTVRLALINYPDHVLIDDKLVFEKLIPGAITSRAFIYNRRIIPTSPDGIKSVEELEGHLGQSGRFILKPRTGGGGQGIRVVMKKDGEYMIGKEACDPRVFPGRLLDFHNYLVYNLFDQSGFSNEIFPSTLNTIRLLTLIEKKSGKPILIGALHRFGTIKSVPVDNWSSGGICASVDLASGRLGPAIAFPYDRQLQEYSLHPDSGKQIEGSEVPHWTDIKDRVLDLHSTIPYIPYIGWDVVLSGNKVYILEANSNSDVNLFQVHEPLLKNEKARSVFKSYGAIK